MIDESTSVHDVVMFVRDWFGPALGASLVVFIWRTSKWITTVEAEHQALRKDHEDLSTEHDETKTKIERTETNLAQTREQIAKLATREDLDRLGERVTQMMSTNFGQLLMLLGVKRDPPA